MPSPSFVAVYFVDVGSKSALSMSTRSVPAAISEPSPPITPATALGFSASAITSIVSSSFRSTPSSVLIVSPGLASRTMISRPASVR